MKYYRLIAKKEEDQVLWSDIVEDELSEDTLMNVNWDKPITRFKDNEHYHFLALDKTYLEAMLGGVATYRELKG